MIKTKIIKKPKNKGASVVISGGLYTSDQGQGSISDLAHADRADYADRSGVATRAEEADHAKTSDVADLAKDLTSDSPVNDRFIRKDQDDRTPYGLSVGGELVAENGARSRDFMSGLLGWLIDRMGNAEFESGKFRSFAEFAEIVANRLTAIEGDQLLTESDTIEEVTDHGDGTFTLRLHPKWDGYFTAQYENNVCKGIFNNITSGLVPSEGQLSMSNAVYYTSWFRILTVNAAANTVDVILYPDSEVPAGRNFPPVEMMRFARWGNSGAADNPEFARRQECLYLSSTEGRIVKMYRVTKPITDKGNVAMTVGRLPEFLPDLSPYIEQGAEGGYFDVLVARQFIQLDHQGRPQPTLRFRGAFDKAGDYYSGDTVRPETLDYERSIVEQNGCQWVNNVTGTHEAPSWRSNAWTFYLGDPNFKVELRGGPQAVNPRRFKFTLAVRAFKGYEDVTADVLPQDVVWTRYSEDSAGNVRVASDNLWALRRGGSGLEIELTEADLDADIGGVPPVCVFTARVTLRDGESELTRTVSMGWDRS